METKTRKRLENEAEELRIKKDALKALEAEVHELQTSVISALDEAEQKTFRYKAPDGAAVTVTRVQVEKLIINEGTLHRALGAKMWPKVTKRVLDEEKLISLIALGEIDDVLVAKHSEKKKNKPFVRIARRES